MYYNIYLNCDAKDWKYYTFAFKIYKSLEKESRRLRTKCDWPLSGPSVVKKVECTKFPVVNYTHKSLKRAHAQGWCWH